MSELIRSRWLPLLAGLGAGVVAIAMLQASLVWVVLAFGALLVLIGSFIVSDAKLYWLALFLLLIPFNVAKLIFYEPENVEAIKEYYDVYAIENIAPQIYAADLPFLVLLGMLVFKLQATGGRIRIPAGLWLSVGFLVWSLVSLLGARAPELGLAWVGYQLKMLVIFLWFTNADLNPRALRFIVGMLVAAVAIQGLVTVYSYLFQTGENLFGTLFGLTQTAREVRQGPSRGTEAQFVYETGSLLRGTGTVGVGNMQAKYYVMLLPLALAMAAASRATFVRILYFGCFLLGFGGLVLTFSRGGLITATIGVATFLILATHAGRLSGRSASAISAGVLLGAVGALPLLYKYLTSRPGFLQLRFDHLRHGFELMLSSPLVGVGMNNFNVGIDRMAFGGIFSHMPIHNHYLRIGIETGILGLLLYLSFVFWVIVQAYRCIWVEDVFLSTMAIALMAGLVGIVVYWMDDIFYDVIIRTQFWVLMALVVVLRQLKANSALASPGPGPGLRFTSPPDSGWHA